MKFLECQAFPVFSSYNFMKCSMASSLDGICSSLLLPITVPTRPQDLNIQYLWWEGGCQTHKCGSAVPFQEKFPFLAITFRCGRILHTPKGQWLTQNKRNCYNNKGSLSYLSLNFQIILTIKKMPHNSLNLVLAAKPEEWILESVDLCIKTILLLSPKKYKVLSGSHVFKETTLKAVP